MLYIQVVTANKFTIFLLFIYASIKHILFKKKTKQLWLIEKVEEQDRLTYSQS